MDGMYKGHPEMSWDGLGWPRYTLVSQACRDITLGQWEYPWQS